ncbi:NUDIX hydrolase [Jiulongibacter sp. NS-SX5]|uniref:NUDIX hydrolase n=1 Tax=Jiulongibacter sp. NS-SX5 TaxID=3463854 RepID=UPI0040586547
MNRVQLHEQLSAYQAFDESEELMRAKMVEFLETTENCFSRSCSERHFTASAWVVNPEKTKTMLIHHKKLNRWLQPGGHCDGDENVYAVSKKELHEETGLLPSFDIMDIFDVDIHKIPARKEIPEHDHYDIRFLFEIGEEQELVQNHETNDLKWFDLKELFSSEPEESIKRLIIKTIG